MVLEIQKIIPAIFIWSQPKIMMALTAIEEYSLLFFLAIGQVNFVALWNFNMGVNRKILNVQNLENSWS